MMPVWLTLDIGNSAVKGALFEGNCLRKTFRLAHPESGEALRLHLRGYAITRAGIASVVPAATLRVEGTLRAAGIPILLVQPTLRLPFRLAYETPHTLGADRLAAAAAAVEYGAAPPAPRRSVVAVDAGTALTFEVIDREAVYRGGLIMPGPQLSRQALHRGTAQLPEVTLSYPAEAIGRSTRAAMQAGIMLGFVEGVRGVLARLRDTLGEVPYVVATGGWGALLQDHLAEIEAVVPHLVQDGIRVLMELNDPGADV